MSGQTPPWIVIDASHQGELRITHTTDPSAPTDAHDIKRYDAAALPTFTDALRRYEQEAAISLTHANSVLAIAGAAAGENIPIARSRWTISRSGLAAILGRPPLILNEVAAQAWALRQASPNAVTLRGKATPDLHRPGRHVVIFIAEGVGAALIDVDGAGCVHVVESEIGHTDFAPADVEEAVLAGKCAPQGVASWEQVLLASTSAMTPNRRANLLGRFTVNTVLALGAWQGALLTGPQLNRLAGTESGEAFDAAFRERRAFRRLLMDIGCWRVGQHEAVITGCLAMIAARNMAK